MERFQQTAGTHGTVPLLTHLRLSPGKLPALMQCVALQVVDMKACGWPSQVWALIPQSQDFGGLGSLLRLHCGTVNSCAYLDLQRLLSILQQPGRTWPPCLGPVLNRVAREGNPQPTPLPACGKWHLHCWHRQDMSRN